MPLLNKRVRDALNDNFRRQLPVRGTDQELDLLPVVRVFTPDAGCAWLLTELDPDDQGMAFGLCDLGMGSPELGYVSLAELEEVRGRLGLPVEVDQAFRPTRSVSACAAAARAAGRIVD